MPGVSLSGGRQGYHARMETSIYLLVLMALAAGAASAIQAPINSQLARGLSSEPLLAALISFGSGTVLLFLLCLWRVDWQSALPQLPQQPGWRYLGGTLGAGFVFTTVVLAPKLGVTNMLFFIIVGQLLTAMLIDHFGLIGMAARPVQIWQVAGVLVVAAGLGLFFFGKRLFG